MYVSTLITVVTLGRRPRRVSAALYFLMAEYSILTTIYIIQSRNLKDKTNILLTYTRACRVSFLYFAGGQGGVNTRARAFTQTKIGVIKFWIRRVR